MRMPPNPYQAHGVNRKRNFVTDFFCSVQHSQRAELRLSHIHAESRSAELRFGSLEAGFDAESRPAGH
jgi:hypothetical protein